MDAISTPAARWYRQPHPESPAAAHDKNLISDGIDIDLNELSVEKEYVEKISKLKKRNLKIIGSYAALNKRKGIDQVVKLLEKRKDLALVFIGEGKEIKNLQN